MTERARRNFFDGPFGQVHARVATPPLSSKRSATKPAIVCLHMSPKSGRSYADVLPLLATERVAIAPDYPGHGESDPPPAEPQVTVEDFAASCWAVVDAVTDGPVHVVGYHTGAMVAVQMAWERPQQVVSVVSLSAPVFTAEERAELDATYSPIPIDEAGTRFSVMWQRVLAHRGPGMTLQMAADSFAENLRAGDDYEWGHRAAFAYSPTYNERLAEVSQPVVVINPADDCFEQSKRADALLQNGRRVDYPQWGHGFLSAFAQDAADAILNFIDEAEQNG